LASNKYKRDFYDYGALKRPGRIDRDLFQDIPDCGDGYGGIQWMMLKAFGTSLFPRFVIEGCEYNGVDTLSAGYVMIDGEPVRVSETAIVVGNDRWLYINQNGVAHTTGNENTAKTGVIIYERDGAGTGYDVRFRNYDNVLRALAAIFQDLTVNQNVDIDGNLDVDGTANLDDVDIDGTLDVAGVSDFHSNVDMNNSNIENVQDLDVDGTLDVDGITDLHSDLDMNNNNIENVQDLDVDGSIDCEGDIDVNGTANLDDTDIDGTLDVSGTTDLHSDIDMNDNNLDDVSSIDGGGDAVEFNDDIDMNDNNITELNTLDSYVYYCNSEADVNAAIAAIGSNYGVIQLISDFSPGAAITINISGVLTIRGPVTLTPSTSADVFDITGAGKCTIEDLIIDDSNCGADTNLIDINEASDNPVVIKNCKLKGNDKNAVNITSENCIVSHCEIVGCDYGVYISGDNNKVSNNEFNDIQDRGVYTTGRYTIVEHNSFHGASGGTNTYVVYINNSHCIVKGNTVHDYSCSDYLYAIRLRGAYSLAVGNIIYNITCATGRATGIYVSSGCDHCTVTGNVIHDVDAHSSTYGICVDTADYCSVIGNTSTAITSSGGLARGIAVFGGTNNIVSGNCIYDIDAHTDSKAIHTGAATNSVVTGNQLGGEVISTNGSDTVANNEA
jgi:parallel beta-helix repeat protein